MKAKKFPQGARNSADPVRKSAGGPPQARRANTPDLVRNHQPAAGIGSSFIEGSQERPHPSFLGKNQTWPTVPEHDFNAETHLEQQRKFLAEARLRLQLLRAEREEAVRRELRVGTGPEVRHP